MFVNARERRHQYLTVEHLLLGLLNTPSSRDVLVGCGANVDELQSRLALYIDESATISQGSGEVDTEPTLGFQRVIQRAILYCHSKGGGKSKVSGGDVVVALFGEKDSHAVYYMHQQGVTRLDVVNFLAHGISKSNRTNSSDSILFESSDINSVGRDFFFRVAEAAGESKLTDTPSKENPKLFISYSHADTECLDRLLVHLKPLERTNTIVCWSDKRIRVGDKWKGEIEKNLKEAAIAILLISADFLASDFIVNNELPPLLLKADANGLRILPVILRPCGFRRDPILSSFQSANDPVAPLLGMTPIDQEALYDKIAEEVAREISSRRST
jgi:hypothetical protein